jgi:hypothetical protein
MHFSCTCPDDRVTKQIMVSARLRRGQAGGRSVHQRCTIEKLAIEIDLATSEHEQPHALERPDGADSHCSVIGGRPVMRSVLLLNTKHF